MKYHSATKKEDRLPLVPMWMEPKHIMLSKGSPTKTDKDYRLYVEPKKVKYVRTR